MIGDMLGTKGIFISEDAVDSLNITLDTETFGRLKDHMLEGNRDEYRCFITGKLYPSDKGIYVPPEKMADALESNLNAKDKLWKLFSEEGIVITEDGQKVSRRELSNGYVKKYEKRIKLGWTKTLVIRQYIKLLRGKIKNMPVY